jgi:CelD/BcsL family acetyltransferase involved in cellulose biosynthesis
MDGWQVGARVRVIMLDVRVCEARTAQELLTHAEAWNELALASPEQQPMLSHAWVASFVEHAIEPGQTWRCLFAYAGEDLVGVLPLVTGRHQVMGARLHGPVDTHTRSGYALLRAGAEHRAFSALVAAVGDQEPTYLKLHLRGIREGAPLLSVRSARGARMSTMPAAMWRGSSRGSFLPVHGSSADYEKGLPGNFRRNIRKASNRCERTHDTVYRFSTGADAGAPELFDKFIQLEASGWKGSAGTAIRCAPRLVEFYTALTQRLSERHWLEWHFLELDGSPVAGHLAIRFGRSLVLFKIAYDEKYARLGPGSLLFREAAFRAFADEGLDEINCLTDRAWHRNWQMSSASYSDMVITRDRPLPALVSLLETQAPVLARRVQATPGVAAVQARLSAARRKGQPRLDSGDGGR